MPFMHTEKIIYSSVHLTFKHVNMYEIMKIINR